MDARPPERKYDDGGTLASAYLSDPDANAFLEGLGAEIRAVEVLEKGEGTLEVPEGGSAKGTAEMTAKNLALGFAIPWDASTDADGSAVGGGGEGGRDESGSLGGGGEGGRDESGSLGGSGGGGKGEMAKEPIDPAAPLRLQPEPDKRESDPAQLGVSKPPLDSPVMTGPDAIISGADPVPPENEVKYRYSVAYLVAHPADYGPPATPRRTEADLGGIVISFKVFYGKATKSADDLASLSVNIVILESHNGLSGTLVYKNDTSWCNRTYVSSKPGFVKGFWNGLKKAMKGISGAASESDSDSKPLDVFILAMCDGEVEAKALYNKKRANRVVYCPTLVPHGFFLRYFPRALQFCVEGREEGPNGWPIVAVPTIDNKLISTFDSLQTREYFYDTLLRKLHVVKDEWLKGGKVLRRHEFLELTKDWETEKAHDELRRGFKEQVRMECLGPREGSPPMSESEMRHPTEDDRKILTHMAPGAPRSARPEDPSFQHWMYMVHILRCFSQHIGKLYDRKKEERRSILNDKNFENLWSEWQKNKHEPLECKNERTFVAMHLIVQDVSLGAVLLIDFNSYLDNKIDQIWSICRDNNVWTSILTRYGVICMFNVPDGSPQATDVAKGVIELLVQDWADHPKLPGYPAPGSALRTIILYKKAPVVEIPRS